MTSLKLQFYFPSKTFTLVVKTFMLAIAGFHFPVRGGSLVPVFEIESGLLTVCWCH